jgi:Lrp/AsnC family transcriptional regulator for asnA, asnC and gidA
MMESSTKNSISSGFRKLFACPMTSPPPSLDAVDQQIVALLRIDGRMTFTEIAKRLDIPEATARYRVQRLLQSGAIQIHAWPNPEKLGTPHILMLYLNVENNQVMTVAEQLTGMDEVRFVAVTAGRYNIIADVYYGTHGELLEFLSKLHQVSGVVSYESQIVLKLLKAEYKYTLTY